MYKPLVRLWVWKGPMLLVVHQLLELPWKSSSPGGCLNSHVTTFPPSLIPASCVLRSFFGKGYFSTLLKV